MYCTKRSQGRSAPSRILFNLSLKHACCADNWKNHLIWCTGRQAEQASLLVLYIKNESTKVQKPQHIDNLLARFNLHAMAEKPLPYSNNESTKVQKLSAHLLAKFACKGR